MADFLRTMSYGAVSSLGLLSQQYPPPLLPKPGKDNARLQKLLKKTAKKKAAQQAQQPLPFRSSLSPVNEASPDLERSDHSTPPRTPETPMYATMHPRFSVRPLYQHVASPYPHHRSFTYGKTARFSPQPYGASSQPVARSMTPRITYTPPPLQAGASPVPGPVSYADAHISPGTPPASPAAPLAPVPASVPTPEISSVPAPKPAPETPPVTAPLISIVAPAPGPAPLHAPVPAPAKTAEHNIHLRPITLITHKAPSPKFNAYDVVRTSSRPMFDVPQITLYTAKTSYYETTTAPLHETTEGRLSYYGRSPSPRPRSRTPTPETARGTSPMRLLAPASNGRRGTSPSSEIRGRATPTSEVKRGRTPTSEVRGRTTPISEVKRGTTPTSEMRGRATPTSEARGRTMPISEVRRGATPTSEMRGRTPTSEVKKGTTAVSDVKRGSTPTTVIETVTTPTVEITTSKTPLGRPKTPSHHVGRAKTPVIEISRPNPLLFAVSPEYMEGRRSKTPTSLSVSGEASPKPLETEQLKVSIPNGGVEMKPLETSTAKTSTEVLSKPETQESTSKTSVKEASEPPPLSATTQPAITVSSADIQRPKTPTQEVSKTDTKAPGHQQSTVVVMTSAATAAAGPPKTKSAQSHAQALKPIIGQRPKTPTYGGARSIPKTYYGLTPAAYVAHGGIQTIAPSYSVSRPLTPSAESPKPEELKTPETQTSSQEAPKAEVPSEQQAKMPVAEVPTQKSASTETKASEGTKPLEVKKSPALQPKTKPVPVVERAKPQVTEGKQAKSPATVPKASVPETQKDKAAISVPPKPKTPTPRVKTPPAQKQIAAPSSKSKTSEKVSDEPKKRDAESKIVKEQSKVSAEPAKPKGSVSGTSTAQTLGTKSISSIVSLKPKASETPKTEPIGKLKEKQTDKEKSIKDVKAEPTPGKTTEEKKEKEDSAFPKAEPLLKTVQKPKGMMKSKLSGWSRLKKHMVVEVEEPKFPESQPGSATEPKKDIPNGDLPKLAIKKKDEDDQASSSSQQTEGKDSPRATQMWDAVLFQMFSSKENIMQQIMADKSEEEKKELEEKVAKKPEDIPTFAHRLPVLLFSPRFDAKRLREAASRPVTKMSTVFEMALIGRHSKDEEPKQFNRTAKGFNASKPTEA